MAKRASGLVPIVALGGEVLVALLLSRSLVVAAYAATVVAAVVVLAVHRSLLPLTILASFLSTRLSGGSVDISVADVALVASSVAALPSLDLGVQRLRTTLALASTYIALLSLNVLVVPERVAVFEWLHRIFLVVGAIVVGAAIAQRGRTAFALRVLFATASVFAVGSIITAASTGFEPAYTFGYHKNWVGPMLAMSALVLQACWRQVGLQLVAMQLLWALFAAGLLATQSRAAMLALAVAMLMNASRSRHGRMKLLLLAPVAVGLVIFAIQSVRLDTTGVNNTEFNTIRSREAGYRLALHRYHDHPFFGAGIRWFKVAGRETVEPHSALFLTLSETGLWGVLALVVLFGGALWLVRKVPGPLAAAAFSLLVFRLVEGQFAIFWIAGVMTLPWIFVGMAAADCEVPGVGGTRSDPARAAPARPRFRPRLVGSGS